MTMYFAKKLNKKGFTLAELLIVVAIIAVLVAIAVPIFTNSLEKARYGVHSSNGRAMKSLAVAELLGSGALANQTLGDSDMWIGYGTYNFGKEEMTVDLITNAPAGSQAGMWCRAMAVTGSGASASVTKTITDIATLKAQTLPKDNAGKQDAAGTHTTWYRFDPDTDGYKTIGRIGTGNSVGVEYIFVFSSVDISELSIVFS